VLSAFLFLACLSWPQPAGADGSFTIADINQTLRGPPQAADSAITRQPELQFTNDAAYSALTAFAAEIGGAETNPASRIVSAEGQFDDLAFSELSAFSEQIGLNKLESIKNQPKFAEADNAVDALREFLQKGSGASPPAASTSGPVAGGKKPRPPVEATFVGKQVCLGCHTTQAEAFGKTLMGRIGKTQQGKFDCENCHGPGSAHAKAGGGRGVGGIV
jgi:hypothetical protein